MENKEIIIIPFPKGILNFSKEKIKEINKNEFIHSAKTEVNSQGNPNFLKNSVKVIGIQKSFHIGNTEY